MFNITFMVTLESFKKQIDLITNAQDSYEFNSIVETLSSMSKSLWPDESSGNSGALIEIKDKTFDFEVSPNPHFSEDLFLKFNNCVFKKDVSILAETIVFINCEFETLTTQECAFHVEVLGGSIRLLNCSHDISKYAFHKVKIKYTSIQGNMKDVLFRRCVFLNQFTSYSSAGNRYRLKQVKFQFCEFNCGPDFLDCTLEKDVLFYGCKFFSLVPINQAYYRDLRHKMNENQDDEYSKLFGALELKCKHHDSQSNIDTILGNLYSIFSNYGINPYRPFVFLLLLFSIARMYFSLDIEYFGTYPLKYSLENFDKFSQINYLSIVAIAGPLRAFGQFDLIKITSPGTQLVLCIFTALSSIIWFFLILAIRKRFKLD